MTTTDLQFKLFDVIQSVTTPAQLASAHRYYKLCEKQYNKLDPKGWERYTNRIAVKLLLLKYDRAKKWNLFDVVQKKLSKMNELTEVKKRVFLG